MPAATAAPAPPEEPPGVHEVGGEPAIGKGRAIGAAENDGAGFAKVIDHGAVALRNHLALDFQPVGGGKAFLVDIDLHRDRHAGKNA